MGRVDRMGTILAILIMCLHIHITQLTQSNDLGNLKYFVLPRGLDYNYKI